MAVKKERRSDAAAVWTSPDRAVLRGGDRRGRSDVVRPFVGRALRRPIRRDRTQVRGREEDRGRGGAGEMRGAGLGQAQGPCRGADGSWSGRGERRASPWLRTCALRVARRVNYVWRKVFKVLNGFPQS